jgi:hypothetical protein
MREEIWIGGFRFLQGLHGHVVPGGDVVWGDTPQVFPGSEEGLLNFMAFTTNPDDAERVERSFSFHTSKFFNLRRSLAPFLFDGVLSLKVWQIFGAVP